MSPYISLALIIATAIFTFINWRSYREAKKSSDDFRQWWKDREKVNNGKN